MRDSMSHWNRRPRPISIHSLLFRIGKNFLLDHPVSNELVRYLPPNTRHLSELAETKMFSRDTVVGICRDKNALLITSDVEHAPFLSSPNKSSWGLILLPPMATEQSDVLRRISEGKLLLRPSAERSWMSEYVRCNRMMLDLRHNPPSITVYSDCHWVDGPQQTATPNR